MTGIDLREPRDDDTRGRLNAAVVENIALVIRNQQFTPNQYLAAVSLFGEPMEAALHAVRAPAARWWHEVSIATRTSPARV